MIKIYKYQIPVAEKYDLILPVHSEILRVDDVDGMFYVWAKVDTNVINTEIRHLELYKTGQEIPDDNNVRNYLGFCKIFIGMELCLYVFENIGSTKY